MTTVTEPSDRLAIGTVDQAERLRARSLLALLAVAAVLGDLAINTVADGVAFTASVAVVVAAVALFTPRRSGWGTALVTASLAPAAFVAARQWLIPLDFVAVFLLIGIGGLLRPGASLFDLRFRSLGRALGIVTLNEVMAPRFLGQLGRGLRPKRCRPGVAVWAPSPVDCSSRFPWRSSSAGCSRPPTPCSRRCSPSSWT
jgi:hypothetical protein